MIPNLVIKHGASSLSEFSKCLEDRAGRHFLLVCWGHPFIPQAACWGQGLLVLGTPLHPSGCVLGTGPSVLDPGSCLMVFYFLIWFHTSCPDGFTFSRLPSPQGAPPSGLSWEYVFSLDISRVSHGGVCVYVLWYKPTFDRPQPMKWSVHRKFIMNYTYSKTILPHYFLSIHLVVHNDLKDM